MNKKFLILLTLTFYIIISSSTFAFSDVDGHWAEKVINDAKQSNIVNGYTDDIFMPDRIYD